MKFSFITVLLSVLLFSCDSHDNKKQPIVNLKMNWDKGVAYYYQNTSEITTQTGILETEQTFKNHTSNFITISLMETVGQTNSFKLTYDSIIQHRDSTTILTDSLKVNQYHILNGKSVTLKMENGKMKSVEGLDSILKVMKDTTSRAKLQELFKPYNLDASLGGLFNFYPKNGVRLGNTWKKETNVSIGGLAVTWNNTFLLKEVKDSTVIIEVKSVNKDDGSFSMNSVDVPIKLSGTENGIYEVLIRDGSIVSGSSTSHFSINIKLGSLNIPMEIDFRNTMRRLHHNLDLLPA